MMLSTLINLCKQLLDDRREWYDIIDKPEISKTDINGNQMNNYVLNIIFDFDNKDIVETINLPLKVYTKEQALELVLIQKSNTYRNVGIIVVVLVAWFLRRDIKNRRRNKMRVK